MVQMMVNVTGNHTENFKQNLRRLNEMDFKPIENDVKLDCSTFSVNKNEGTGFIQFEFCQKLTDYVKEGEKDKTNSLYVRQSNEGEWKPVTYEENMMNDNANTKGKLYGKNCDYTVIDELKAMGNYEDYRNYANIVNRYTGATTTTTYPWFVQDEETLRKNIKKFNETVNKYELKLPHWYYAPIIKKVIFCPPATIVMWADGTKTVVRTHEEEFSEEHGLAMALAKKYFGSRSEFLRVVKDAKRVDADKKKAKKKAKKPKAASKTTKTVKRTTKKTTKASKEKK